MYNLIIRWEDTSKAWTTMRDPDYDKLRYRRDQLHRQHGFKIAWTALVQERGRRGESNAQG